VRIRYPIKERRALGEPTHIVSPSEVAGYVSRSVTWVISEIYGREFPAGIPNSGTLRLVAGGQPDHRKSLLIFGKCCLPKRCDIICQRIAFRPPFCVTFRCQSCFNSIPELSGEPRWNIYVDEIKHVSNCVQTDNSRDPLGKAIAPLRGSTLWPRSANKF
jgi:hypothetical protein